jgi:hypothetical protein
MFRVGQLTAVLFAALPALLAGSVKPATNLTIILDFKGPHSAKADAAMKQETQAILKEAGVHLDWKSLEEARNTSFPDLVVVRFNGACELPPGPLYDQVGPLGSTYETDGQVQPFSVVSCDRVSAFVRSGLHGRDFKRGDFLLGRALGRVVAHELVHMLTGATDHSHEGVFRSALTVQELVTGELPLSHDDVERLRASH